MRFTCQSWGILHSEKRGELADQARGFSRVAAAPYPGYLLCRFFAGWRLRLTRATCCAVFCRVAAAPYPGYLLCRFLPGCGYALPGLLAVPFFLPGGGCALPGLHTTLSRDCSPGKRSATGERRGNYAKMALQIASPTCCVEALPFMSGVFGPQAIVCSIAARMPS